MKNETNRTPVMIPVKNLRPFEGHPYKVKDDDEMNALIESIQEQGILSPLVVRPIENTNEYEVISGHRRLQAAEKAGITEIPALIYALDRDAAAIAVVDSNLHREHILPSEKAFAYKLKIDALSHQGTSTQLAWKSETADVIGKKESISGDTVRRYIRLTHLIPEILEYVDEGKIAFTPAVELSFLTEQEQWTLLDQMEINDCTPSLSQACRMKKISQAGELSMATISEIMCEGKANQKEKLKIPMERIRDYFPKSYATADIENAIVKLCENYYRQRQRSRNDDER